MGGTAAVAIAMLLACTAIAGAPRRRPLALRVAIAFSIMIAVEAIIACALSVFHLFGRGPVTALHVSFVLGVVLALSASRRVRADLVRARQLLRSLKRWDRSVVALVVVPLAAALFLIAAAYQPSNWDSMTYRLARVAHWVQHRSVAPYPTAIPRQVALPAGAEYVLASWQVMSGDDRLANFLQLGCWLAVALAMAPLARMAGAPRRIALAAVVVAACVPMAVLQATSTQNDLVASVIVVAEIAAVFPFLHRHARFHVGDGALLGVVVAAGWLTKPSALLAASPFLAWAAFSALRSARVGAERATGMRTALAALGLALAVVAPDAIVRLSSADVRASNGAIASEYVYPPFDELADRATNLVRGFVRQFPAPVPVRRALRLETPDSCGAEPLCEGGESVAHEDLAGNPLHAALAAAFAVVAIIRWRSIPRRARATVLLVAGAWALFQVTFRPNPWISRLELPVYCLSALMLAGIAAPGRRRLAGEIAVAVAVAVIAVAGYRVAVDNVTRPLAPALGRPYPVADYYVNRPVYRVIDDVALRIAEYRGCSRLGLYVGGDSYDYPLTWRAMQRGIETRHVVPGDGWACLVVTDGTVEIPPGAPWRADGATFVLRNLAARAEARQPEAPLRGRD